jgi:hypothetical protein
MLGAIDAVSQGPDPCPPQEPNCDQGAPIDGISSLLIAGGIIFGGKKAYDLNKKNEEN